MVSAARIEWILAQLRQGRQIRLRTNSHVGKCVVHAELLDHFCPTMLNQIAIDLFIALRAQLAYTVVVDHGHQSSSGSSRISFSVKRCPVGSVMAVSGSQSTSGNDYGPNVDRPRRGRSPPSAPDGNDGNNDPWHSGDHADPWSAPSAGRQPVAKAPRKNIADASWKNYVVSNYGATCSVTPDPPALRNSFACVPARTGTPPIAVVSGAMGSD